MAFGNRIPATFLVPIKRTESLIGSIINGILVGIPCVALLYTVLQSRNQDKMFRRRVQASEMKALKARLDRFQARIDSGEVVDKEEMNEGKTMERLFRRWLRSLEDEVKAEDERRSLAVRVVLRYLAGWL